MRPFILLIVAGMLAVQVQGAIIQGTVYDFQLKPVSAVVEINTTPRQVFVAANSTYVLSVQEGSYQIEAREVLRGEVVAEVTENITVSRDGVYSLDLITFPVLEEIVPVDEDMAVDTSLLQEKTGYGFWIAGIVLLVFLIVYFWKRAKPELKQESQLHPDVEQLLSFIKKEGRATQKDIRQQFPVSEAKISLMLTELEAKGLIKKIKKGRGNIITLP